MSIADFANTYRKSIFECALLTKGSKSIWMMPLLSSANQYLASGCSFSMGVANFTNTKSMGKVKIDHA